MYALESKYLLIINVYKHGYAVKFHQLVVDYTQSTFVKFSFRIYFRRVYQRSIFEGVYDTNPSIPIRRRICEPIAPINTNLYTS